MENEKILQLRPYQQEIAEKILKASVSKSKVLISIAVGSGRIITIALNPKSTIRKRRS